MYVYIYIIHVCVFIVPTLFNDPASSLHLVDPTNGSSPIEAMSPQRLHHWQPSSSIAGKSWGYFTDESGV